MPEPLTSTEITRLEHAARRARRNDATTVTVPVADLERLLEMVNGRLATASRERAQGRLIDE